MNTVQKKATIKICVVCGDKANGYNFNAISCESCKAFFRRNALRKKVFKCTFNNQCNITVLSRKFCQKCRLQKCLNQGMNKNLILSDEEKKLMKNKVKENQNKRTWTNNVNSNYVTTTCINQFPSYSNENTNSSCETNMFVDKFLSFIHEPSPNNEQAHIYHENHLTSLNFDQDTISDNSENLDKCFLLKNFEHIFYSETEAKEGSVNTISGLLLCEDSSEDCAAQQKKVIFSAKRGLNFLEQYRLNELNNAFYRPENMPLGDIPPCVKHSDLFRVIEISVRRLIKGFKRIEAFRSLCSLDQIALLKAGCTQISILRSIRGYNFEKQAWTINKDGKDTTILKLELMKESSTPSFYETHKQFMKTLSEEWDSDVVIINLLSLIILFNANRPDIIHKHMIAFEYQTHKYLLQRYLDTKYTSKFESSKKFYKLMKILEELHYLNEESVRWHLETDPQQIGPLLIEIFDLKY